jgi:hypothetical protein
MPKLSGSGNARGSALSPPVPKGTRLGGPGYRRLRFVTLVVIGLSLATSACGGGSLRAGVASLGTTTTTVAVTAGPAAARPTGGTGLVRQVYALAWRLELP